MKSGYIIYEIFLQLQNGFNHIVKDQSRSKVRERPVTLLDTVPSMKMNLDRKFDFRGPKNRFSSEHI